MSKEEIFNKFGELYQKNVDLTFKQLKAEVKLKEFCSKHHDVLFEINKQDFDELK